MDLSVIGNNPDLQADVAPEAKGLIKKYQENIYLSYTKWKKRYREIEHARRYSLGRINKTSQVITNSQLLQESGRIVKGNIIHATLQGLLPHIYAKNPEIKIRPVEYVEPTGQEYRMSNLFAETLEMVLAESYKRAELKKVAKQIIRSCMTSKIGILKVTYQRDYYKDPLVSRQFNDAQESLAKIQADIISLQETGTYEGDKDEIVEELEQTMMGLQNQVDVMYREGLNLGFVKPEDFRMDTSLDSLLDYENAKWMANCTWMTPKEVQERFSLSKEEVDKFTIYRRTQDGIPGRIDRDNKIIGMDGEEDVNLACAIWEYWDKGTMTVYTWAEGGGQWIKPPFYPNRMGERWCPFFILGLNWIDGQEWPVAEVELMMSLQDEYNTVREQMAKHRELSAQFFVADASRVNYEDIETFSDATIGDIALINAGGTGVNNVFQPAQVPPMNYQVYDTTPIRSDIEWISGLGDAQRGGIIRSKTATEANIQNEGLATRISEKVDSVEVWLRDVSKFSAQLLLQEVTPQKAIEIAGPHAFWPILNKQHLYDSVYIQITAGSTAMPNENEERMRWIELMPLIMQNIQMIQQLRDVGVPDEFNPYIQLLEETFKRFDERIDVAKFMPPMPEDIQQQAVQNQIMQSMMMSGGPSQGGTGKPGMPSDMTQQLNEVRNVPNNRVDQRERNQYRPSSLRGA